MAGCSQHIFAQQYTVSAELGKGIIHGGTSSILGSFPYGAGASVSWPVVHEQNHRRPYRMGLMADFVHIPGGIAGDRADIGGFVRSPLFFTHPSALQHLPAGDLSFELCTGFGFYSLPRSYTGNEDNEFIATPINCLIEFGPVYSQPLCIGGALVAGFKFVHNSNGFFAKPNVGLNFLQAELGWRFDPKERRGEESRTLSFSDKYDARTSFFVMGAGGMTVPSTSQAHNGELYPAYTAQAGWRYAYQRCRAIEFTLEGSYSFANDYDLIKAGEKTPFPLFLSVAASHVTYWGPVSVRLGCGFRFWEPHEWNRMFERAGVYYNFYGKSGRHQFAGVAIKASFIRADYIEWSYGIDLW